MGSYRIGYPSTGGGGGSALSIISVPTIKTVGAGKDFETILDAFTWIGETTFVLKSSIVLTLDDGIHELDDNVVAPTLTAPRISYVHILKDLNITFESASGNKADCVIQTDIYVDYGRDMQVGVVFFSNGIITFKNIGLTTGGDGDPFRDFYFENSLVKYADAELVNSLTTQFHRGSRFLMVDTLLGFEIDLYVDQSDGFLDTVTMDRVYSIEVRENSRVYGKVITITPASEEWFTFINRGGQVFLSEEGGGNFNGKEWADDKLGIIGADLSVVTSDSINLEFDFFG